MKKLFLGLFCFLSAYCQAETSRWDGKYYAANSGFQQQFAMEALKLFPMSPEDSVLDIGCGDGRITHYISTLVPQGYVIGLDKNPSMIATAKTYQNDKLSYILGDAAALPYKNTFTSIVSFNALHWVDDPQAAIRSINEALVPGGKVLILIAYSQPRYPFHDAMNSVAHSDKWKSYFGPEQSVVCRHTFGEWANYIESEGLIPEKIQLIDTSLNYPSKKACGAWFAGWIPFGTIPDDKKDDYVKDITDAYEKIIPCEADGTTHFLFDELIIIASKPTSSYRPKT
jgi:trans-aconitate methyltransferase